MGIMNIPNHVEIDEMEELRMLEQAVASLASKKLGWQDDLARARISVKMTQVTQQQLQLHCIKYCILGVDVILSFKKGRKRIKKLYGQN